MIESMFKIEDEYRRSRTKMSKIPIQEMVSGDSFAIIDEASGVFEMYMVLEIMDHCNFNADDELLTGEVTDAGYSRYFGSPPENRRKIKPFKARYKKVRVFTRNLSTGKEQTFTGNHRVRRYTPNAEENASMVLYMK